MGSAITVDACANWKTEQERDAILSRQILLKDRKYWKSRRGMTNHILKRHNTFKEDTRVRKKIEFGNLKCYFVDLNTGTKRFSATWNY